jgi:hypothetical protein
MKEMEDLMEWRLEGKKILFSVKIDVILTLAD